MHKLKISSLDVEVDRKDIKNLHLSVHPPEGHVRVAAPQDVDDDEVRTYVISKLGWIKKHQATFQGQDRQSPRVFESGESHFVGGQRYLLNVIKEEGLGEVRFDGSNSITMALQDVLNFEQKRDLMKRWYRARLQLKLDKLVPDWAAKIGVDVTAWKIKQMKTKWGSCNREKRVIWLNLELAKKPDRCIEYVVVHELAHLHERHHNHSFIAILDRHLPSWRVLREELHDIVTTEP